MSAELSASAAIPWRTGRWHDAVAALKALAATHAREAVTALLHASFTLEDVKDPVAQARMQRIGALASAFGADPDGALAFRYAEQADVRGAAVCHLVSNLHRIRFAADDPVLSQKSLTAAELAEVRAVTVEDVECVFDLDAMAICAQRLALFLIEQARRDHRYDDFRTALRIEHLYLSGSRTEPAGLIELAGALLDYILHQPALSPSEAAERVRQTAKAGRMVAMARASGPVPAHVEALLERASALTPEALPASTRPRHYEAESARLRAAYQATGNADYLADLIWALDPSSPYETDEQQAIRLSQLGGAYYARGFLRDDPGDFTTAMTKQFTAATLVGAEHPVAAEHAEDGAASYLAYLLAKNEPICSHLDSLRACLPPLPAVPPQR